MLHPGSNLATDVVLSQGTHGPNEPTPWGGELPGRPEGQILNDCAQSTWGQARGPAIDPHSPQVVASVGWPYFGPVLVRGGAPSFQHGGPSGADRHFYPGPGLTHAGPHTETHAGNTERHTQARWSPGLGRPSGIQTKSVKDRSRPLLTAGKDGWPVASNSSASNSMVEGEHALSSYPAAAYAAVQDS